MTQMNMVTKNEAEDIRKLTEDKEKLRQTIVSIAKCNIEIQMDVSSSI